MALTDQKIRNAKAKEKPYKIADEKGLFLFIKTSGSKYWRLNNAENFYLKMGCEKIGVRQSPMMPDRYSPVLSYTVE